MILSVLSSPSFVSGLMVAHAKNPVHSVSFPIPVFRKLAERVDELQREHLNRGNHKPFPFRTKREQERLYSVLWEE